MIPQRWHSQSSPSLPPAPSHSPFLFPAPYSLSSSHCLLPHSPFLPPGLSHPTSFTLPRPAPTWELTLVQKQDPAGSIPELPAQPGRGANELAQRGKDRTCLLPGQAEQSKPCLALAEIRGRGQWGGNALPQNAYGWHGLMSRCLPPPWQPYRCPCGVGAPPQPQGAASPSLPAGALREG